jgi:GntR family transcriptional regulator
MEITLSSSSMTPIYEQLTTQIKSLVIDGKLAAGEALPSVRSLAAELKISALTVKKAYDRLEEEGLIVTVHGKGSFVERTDTQLALEFRRHEAEKQLAEALARAEAAGLSREEILETVTLLLDAQ